MKWTTNKPYRIPELEDEEEDGSVNDNKQQKNIQVRSIVSR